MKDVHSVLEKSAKTAAGRLAIQILFFYTNAYTGPVYLDFVGSTGGFIDYTVLGDSANVSARLQGLAAKYGVPALISGDTFRAANKPSSFRLLDVVQVKNRQEPIDIYTQPLDLGSCLRKPAPCTFRATSPKPALFLKKLTSLFLNPDAPSSPPPLHLHGRAFGHGQINKPSNTREKL